MPVHGKIIGVDLDGVCSDFYGRMREIAAEWFECQIDDLTTKVSYGLKEWGIEKPEHYESLHRFAVAQRGLFESSPMIHGARSYLRKLSNEGARIRIITHRLFIHYFSCVLGCKPSWLAPRFLGWPVRVPSPCFQAVIRCSHSPINWQSP